MSAADPQQSVDSGLGLRTRAKSFFNMNQEMKLLDLLDAVVDEESFLVFAKALQADKEDEDEKANPNNPYSHGWNGWQTSGTADFLESAIAWAEDSKFGSQLESKPNEWKKFALFLFGGKIYE